MATTTRITLDQYLKTPFEPDAEFVNGEVEERNVGEYEHSVVQFAIVDWCRRNDKTWNTRSVQEQRTLLRSGNIRIPDVSVWKRDVPVEPVFSHPQFIAIEVLSPEDRQSRVQEKIEDYRQSGIPNVWIIDPVKRVGWDCSDGNWTRKSRFEVAGTPVHLDLEQLFRELDAAEA